MLLPCGSFTRSLAAWYWLHFEWFFSGLCCRLHLDICCFLYWKHMICFGVIARGFVPPTLSPFFWVLGPSHCALTVYIFFSWSFCNYTTACDCTKRHRTAPNGLFISCHTVCVTCSPLLPITRSHFSAFQPSIYLQIFCIFYHVFVPLTLFWKCWILGLDLVCNLAKNQKLHVLCFPKACTHRCMPCTCVERFTHIIIFLFWNLNFFSVGFQLCRILEML